MDDNIQFLTNKLFFTIFNFFEFFLLTNCFLSIIPCFVIDEGP